MWTVADVDCGRCGLWPTWSVAVMVWDGTDGRYGRLLGWNLKSLQPAGSVKEACGQNIVKCATIKPPA